MSDGGRVEAAARVLHDRFAVGTTLRWEDASPLTKDRYLADARAVLAAADTTDREAEYEWGVIDAGDAEIRYYNEKYARLIAEQDSARLYRREVRRGPWVAAGAGTPGETPE